MVTPGQFLERPALIPVGKHVLEGLSHRGTRAPGVLILPPLPEEGSFDHVLAAELAWACAHAGHPELRFNYGGVGASQGPRSRKPSSLLADAAAALELLCENSSLPGAAVAALGGSAEVGLALQRADPRVAAVALVMPAGTLTGASLARVGVPLLVLVAEDAGQELAPLSRSVQAAGGTLRRLEGLDAGLTRNLPEVGRTLVTWLAAL